MTADKLDSRQKLSLNKTLQAALDRSAASLQLMLGGDINIGMTPTASRTPGVCVCFGLTGALEGGIYVDLPEKMALEIVKTLTTGRELSLLDEVAWSILMELGNILASVFVGYFDEYRGLRTLPTPPALSLVPHDIPSFTAFFSATLSWSKSQERAKVFVGLDQSALDILLAG